MALLSKYTYFKSRQMYLQTQDSIKQNSNAYMQIKISKLLRLGQHIRNKVKRLFIQTDRQADRQTI